MEVVEHVADVPLFVQSCAEMVKSDGLMVAATLNRTLKSFALAIVGAEYILGWLPRGTHQWEKFVTPDELADAVEAEGLSVADARGVSYSPLADGWSLSRDTSVNYMLATERLPSAPSA
jgi:2-polyprenyl-6-hydroxyphenyl methylase / 3-demethylubiquinone-9 3-methyltransferase